METELREIATDGTIDNTKNALFSKLKVIRRNGTVTPFDANKIIVAMTKTFLAVEGSKAKESARIRDIVNECVTIVIKILANKLPDGGMLGIEDIQDQVELALMRTGHYPIAKAYMLYRAERCRIREQQLEKIPARKPLHVKLPDGQSVLLDFDRLIKLVNSACENLPDVSADLIIEDAHRNLFDHVPLKEVSKALIMSARALIEKEPNYSFVAARLLLDDLRSEALSFLKLKENATFSEMEALYELYLKKYIEKGIELELLDKKLNTFNITKLAKAMVPTRDLQFTYLGLQTLYDRYFIHQDGVHFELPQAFFMRVAMGLALNEKDKEERAIEFYHLLSTFDFMSSTPTLFNSGTPRPQLSSCNLTTIPDDLDGIFAAIKDNALLSKYAGGLGNDWTSVRALGARIKGTNGKSLGVVPFLSVANATAVAVNQGGKRKGAVCAYLETWHKDIEEFLELRKNTGDERRRTHDMNTANWIPDLFMQRVIEEKDWTLFSPDEVPDLHEKFGAEFTKAYIAYEKEAEEGKILSAKKLPALTLWRKMLSMLFETGHPWMTFKDPCNLRSPQQHTGVVHSSNLCTEITLNTSLEEIAVCNLGSINLTTHMTKDGLDEAKLRRTITTAIRMLDNVIDINFYSVPQARNSNLKHRPIGLGLMGFQDALYQLNIPYTSDKAVTFADRSMELISYYALEASALLAEERGSYETFAGSLWHQGILPIDSIQLLANYRGKNYLEQDNTQTLDWDSLRKRIKKGMRNSNVLAIAPTATIANITGVSQSIEPTYQNLFVKSNLSGEFTVINPYLVTDLKELGIWDEVMVNDLKYYNGSVSKINRIPLHLKEKYATAFEINPNWLVEAASRRQKWIDQAQSLNLYMAEPSGKKLDQLYRLVWLRGLKTSYYLRSMGATHVERSTVHDGALNSVQSNGAPNACLITDPTCEACQ